MGLNKSRADITNPSQNKIQTGYFIGTISHKRVNLTLVNTVNFEGEVQYLTYASTLCTQLRHITRNQFYANKYSKCNYCICRSKNTNYFRADFSPIVFNSNCIGGLEISYEVFRKYLEF